MHPWHYGGSQARGRIGAAAVGLCQSRSNARSKPRLQPTPQLTATPEARDRICNLIAPSPIVSAAPRWEILIHLTRSCGSGVGGGWGSGLGERSKGAVLITAAGWGVGGHLIYYQEQNII